MVRWPLAVDAQSLWSHTHIARWPADATPPVTSHNGTSVPRFVVAPATRPGVSGRPFPSNQQTGNLVSDVGFAVPAETTHVTQEGSKHAGDISAAYILFGFAIVPKFDVVREDAVEGRRKNLTASRCRFPYCLQGLSRLSLLGQREKRLRVLSTMLHGISAGNGLGDVRLALSRIKKKKYRRRKKKKKGRPADHHSASQVITDQVLPIS